MLPGRAKGVERSIAVSQRADLWARGVHSRFFHPNSSGTTAWMSPPVQVAAPRGVDAVGADVWTNLAKNALAIQAASKSATTAVAKKGFKAFPITTQQMIPFASERDNVESARSAPVETYTEILVLTNAAYVAQHLHSHFRSNWDWTCCCLLISAPQSGVPPPHKRGTRSQQSLLLLSSEQSVQQIPFLQGVARYPDRGSNVCA